MKKAILFLFACVTILSIGQVPQRFNKVIVTGDITSPKFIKTGSTIDSVLLGNGSAKSVASFKTDTMSLSNRINLKEPLLPSTPTSPETKWLNGNKQWAEMVMGSGGYASNVYFANLTSTIVGSYKQTSGTHELTETIASGTCNNNEVLIYTYLFEQPVGITTVDAGVWRFTMNCAINSNVGDSKFKIVQFRRSAAGFETDMFTIYSNTIENTDYQNFIIETVQPSFLVDSLDHFGCRIYATTTTTVNKTISYKVGDGYASYLNTPLALRHPQLRDPNGNPNVQHLTAAQVAKVDATSGTNTGDETLTSIKTKLGAASAVTDGYLKYQDWVSFRDKVSTETDPTIYAWAKSANKPLYTFSEVGAEQAFTKNTGFNLPIGTTAGTVLEGRTFGTAANSAVGDFIQNQNSSSQSANINISGGVKALSGFVGRVLNWDSEISFLNLAESDYQDIRANMAKLKSLSIGSLASNNDAFIDLKNSDGNAYNLGIRMKTFSDLYGFTIQNNANGTDADLNILRHSNSSTGTSAFRISRDNGNVVIASTIPSTSPTTGALVVGGGVGADHVRANNFYGNGSNLTGVQAPITLTTNGTSGAATFSGNVLNVPNYTGNGDGGDYSSTVTASSGVNAVTLNGSTYSKSGSAYTVGLSGLVTTSSASGSTCRFTFTLPTAPSSSTSMVANCIIYANNVIQPATIYSISTNTVEIGFISGLPAFSQSSYSIICVYR